MDNNTIVRRINKYQSEPVFHPLTCGNDSEHELLQAEVQNNKVVLLCKDCGYTQEYIPEIFFVEGFEEVYEETASLLVGAVNQEETIDNECREGTESSVQITTTKLKE